MNEILSTENEQLVQQRDAFIERLLQSTFGVFDLFALYVTDVHGRLQSDPPARVATIGCAVSGLIIGLAQTYPKVRVDGYDSEKISIEQAWASAHAAGLTDRVTFHVRDVGDGTLNGRYDLITALEGIHHLGNPVGVLKVMRRLAGKDGAVMVMAECTSVGTLECNAQEAGFHSIEVLPIDNVFFRLYRLNTVR